MKIIVDEVYQFISSVSYSAKNIFTECVLAELMMVYTTCYLRSSLSVGNLKILSDIDIERMLEYGNPIIKL